MYKVLRSRQNQIS